ncbi:hypothetical protein AB0A74_01205 [Saccharothrix sp. NPDC042600]|uniref:hypothetical protein n=1 Tax=Saccharothrix TaxID=2071 RepID=UPI0033E11BC6|nr:hypothetical protein GCM10017745_49490 [Saccharothrix mutabilis subsp. capreolus]
MSVFRKLAVVAAGALLFLIATAPAVSATESKAASSGTGNPTRTVESDFCDYDHLCFYRYERFRSKFFDDEFPEVLVCYNLPTSAASMKNGLQTTVRTFSRPDCDGDSFDISPRTSLKKTSLRWSFMVLED